MPHALANGKRGEVCSEPASVQQSLVVNQVRPSIQLSGKLREQGAMLGLDDSSNVKNMNAHPSVCPPLIVGEDVGVGLRLEKLNQGSKIVGGAGLGGSLLRLPLRSVPALSRVVCRPAQMVLGTIHLDATLWTDCCLRWCFSMTTAGSNHMKQLTSGGVTTLRAD